MSQPRKAPGNRAALKPRIVALLANSPGSRPAEKSFSIGGVERAIESFAGKLSECFLPVNRK